MQLQDIWGGFNSDQYRYIVDIIKHSDAKSICEIGTFVGTTAKHVWEGIRETGKTLYLVDNYKFIPKDKREKFFKTVKHSIDNSTQDIITVLEDSHEYNWTQHNFVIFGHHDGDHMIPDFERLIDSDVDYALIGDGMPRCFQRTKTIFEFLSSRSNNGYKVKYYLDGLMVVGKKDLECTLPTTDAVLFGDNVKVMPKTEGNYLKALNELKRIYQLD
jgi:hypothetical protein